MISLNAHSAPPKPRSPRYRRGTCKTCGAAVVWIRSGEGWIQCEQETLLGIVHGAQVLRRFYLPHARLCQAAALDLSPEAEDRELAELACSIGVDNDAEIEQVNEVLASCPRSAVSRPPEASAAARDWKMAAAGE